MLLPLSSPFRKQSLCLPIYIGPQTWVILDSFPSVMSILSKYHQFDLQNISKIWSLLTTTHYYHSNSSYRPSLWAISPQQRGIPPNPKSDIVTHCSDPSKVLMTYKAPPNLASISLWPHFFYSLCFSDLAIYFSSGLPCYLFFKHSRFTAPQSLWSCCQGWNEGTPRYRHGFLFHFLRVFAQMLSLCEAIHDPPHPLFEE